MSGDGCRCGARYYGECACGLFVSPEDEEINRLRARLRESVATGLERMADQGWDEYANWPGSGKWRGKRLWAIAQRGRRPEGVIRGLLDHYARLIREHKEPAWVTKAIEG